MTKKTAIKILAGFVFKHLRDQIFWDEPRYTTVIEALEKLGYADDIKIDKSFNSIITYKAKSRTED